MKERMWTNERTDYQELTMVGVAMIEDDCSAFANECA